MGFTQNLFVAYIDAIELNRLDHESGPATTQLDRQHQVTIRDGVATLATMPFLPECCAFNEPYARLPVAHWRLPRPVQQGWRDQGRRDRRSEETR
jgi:hypothetical protein